jgi:hypothetical protein
LNQQAQDIQQQLDGPSGIVGTLSTLMATVNTLGTLVETLRAVLFPP